MQGHIEVDIEDCFQWSLVHQKLKTLLFVGGSTATKSPL